MSDLSPLYQSYDSASPRKPVEFTLVEEVQSPNSSIEITNDDFCNFSITQMQEQPLKSGKAGTQLPRKKTKKTKLNIRDIWNEKALGDIEEECDATIVDYVHNIDDDCMLYSGKQENINLVTDDNVVTTHYTSKKVTTDEHSDKCVII
jgi:hypothetical protein